MVTTASPFPEVSLTYDEVIGKLLEHQIPLPQDILPEPESVVFQYWAAAFARGEYPPKKE